jgi:Mn-dependent DtxR family transcriptional regulator
MNEDIKITETTARVLEDMLSRLHPALISLSRKGIANRLSLTPAQVSRSLRELETKGVIFYDEGGHMYIDKSLCGYE